ncbi:response regulator transcription factor [Ottowia sp. GY511]|uniref:PleD family two-component system response regulator n=1 Tax=Ottowia flava TaxID=2675430 RepID=A0ABW4KWU5_9BURK|nr:response regulator transcription factor [Ottowia sp. GY511]TXK28505.1 response regulator transcription factor [Ottowia sp. GY511]
MTDLVAPDILIVEDDSLAADLLKFVLERDGYRVAHVSDGRAARRAIETQVPPRLAVIDIDLPYHDGYELIQAIRVQPAWRHLPILMISSQNSERDIARALDEGADDFVVKPFQIEVLKARVRLLLRRGR